MEEGSPRVLEQAGSYEPGTMHMWRDLALGLPEPHGGGGGRARSTIESPYFLICKVEKVKVKSLSSVPLFATPWIVACQALLSIGFSRQEY